MNSIEVKIAGQRFELRSDEKIEHVEEVVRLVRERIERLSRAQPSMSSQKAAILAAFGFASDLVKNGEKVCEIESRVERILASLGSEPDETASENEEIHHQQELFEAPGLPA